MKWRKEKLVGSDAGIILRRQLKSMVLGASVHLSSDNPVHRNRTTAL